jgi:hypothetical protein
VRVTFVDKHLLSFRRTHLGQMRSVLAAMLELGSLCLSTQSVISLSLKRSVAHAISAFGCMSCMA